MVLVVHMESKKILARFEAWDKDCIEDANQWATENGYEPVKEQLTFNGDLVIWVR